MTRGVLSVLVSAGLICAYSPSAQCDALNFKIYSPGAAQDKPSTPDSGSSDKFKVYTPPAADGTPAPAETPAVTAPATEWTPPSIPTTPASSDADKPLTQSPSPAEATPPATNDAPAAADAPAANDAPAPAPATPETTAAPAMDAPPPVLKSETPEVAPTTDGVVAPATSQINSVFDKSTDAATAAPAVDTKTADTAPAADAQTAATAPAADAPAEAKAPAADAPTEAKAPAADAQTADAAPADGDKKVASKQVLQGYVHVVPTGTKIPIIMDTAVDSDTSQEGDEFEARTAEDLSIDGQVAVPAGSVIKGRIATLAAPKHMLRSGSVALKFDTVTTPDNRQLPLVANIVAHGGVVHARRGMKDIAIDTGIFALPTVAGLAIGAVAGNSQHSLGVGGGALIGAGIGAAVGVAVLLAKKGKKIDVRPGDELKIELAEDLRMPTM